MKLIKTLKSPYPNSGGTWKLIVLVSCFVSIFLIYFEPFGLSDLETPRRIQIILGYGGVTFLTLLFNLYFLKSVFPNYFHERNWNVIRHITWLIWILFTIGMGNYFYSLAVIDHFSASWRLFGYFQLFTAVIGVFPITTITLILHNVYLEKYGRLASGVDQQNRMPIKQERSDSSQKIALRNHSGSEELIFELGDFLFIESIGNYICIYWLNNQKIEKASLRCSLKNAMEQLVGIQGVLQCHRAFIVNMRHVIKVKGNAQGYQLTLKNYSDSIPVSRSFVAEFNKEFNS